MCAVAPVAGLANTLVAAECVLTHAVAAARCGILHAFIHIWGGDEDTGQLLTLSVRKFLSSQSLGVRSSSL